MDYDKYIKSTGTHYISNSGHDENGKYHGGKAGDQTGDEWQLRSWYNRPWSCVLRWGDQAAALLAAQQAIDAALNDNVGYDQYDRKTLWPALERALYWFKQIKEKCEADCTEGVVCIWKSVGYLRNVSKLKSLSLDIYSGNMRTAFKNAGFTVLTDSKYRTSGDYLLPGDVLLYEGHHAATNVTLGKKAAAWHPEGEIPAPIGGLPLIRITGSSVNVRSAPNTSGKILGVAHRGDTLEYQGQASADGWLLVVYKGQNAWVSPKYAEIMSARVKITGGSVNVRSEPNAASKALGIVHAGESFAQRCEDRNGWHGINYAGKNGWVSGKYSEVI